MPVYYLGDVEGRLYVDLDMPEGTYLGIPSAQLPDITPPSRTRCTKDVRQCPDGSFVARSGPNCAFAPCPTDSLEAETIALEEQINRSGESATYDFASGIVQQYLEGIAMFQLLLNAKLEEKAFDEKVAGLVKYTQSLPAFQPNSTSTYRFPMMNLVFVPMDGGSEDSKVEFFRSEYGARLQEIATPGSDIEGDTQLTFSVRSPTAEQELFALVQEASMNPALGAEVALRFFDVKSTAPSSPASSTPVFSQPPSASFEQQLPEEGRSGFNPYTSVINYPDPKGSSGGGTTYTDPMEPNPYSGFQWDGYTQGPESLWYQLGLIPGPDGKYIDGWDGPGGGGSGGGGSGGGGSGGGGSGGGGSGGGGSGGGGSGGGGGGSGSGGTSDYDDEDFEVAGYKDGWIVYRNLHNGKYYTNRGEAYGGYRQTSF